MIRDSLPDDIPDLLDLTDATGQFKPLEIEALGEVLHDYFAENQDLGHRCLTLLDDQGALLGFAYFAPAAMTVQTWYLYWIVVASKRQGGGHGSRLLLQVEEAIRAEGGRMLLIETSSLPSYELTRRFYLKHGYEQEAVIREFYAPGDSMIVFRKAFA